MRLASEAMGYIFLWTNLSAPIYFWNMLDQLVIAIISYSYSRKTIFYVVEGVGVMGMGQNR